MYVGFFQNLSNIKQKAESITYLFCNTKESPVLTIMNRQKHVQVCIIYVKRISYIYNCVPPIYLQWKIHKQGIVFNWYFAKISITSKRESPVSFFFGEAVYSSLCNCSTILLSVPLLSNRWHKGRWNITYHKHRS